MSCKNNNLLIFTVIILLISFPQSIFSQPGDEGVSFIYAKKLYDDEMYNLAAEQFHLFAEENQTHPKAAEALQMAGLSYLKIEDYKNAKKELTYLIVKFPDAQNLDQAQFKLAECFQVTGDFKKAAKAFRQVQIFYPKSSLAQQALIFSAQMHSKDKNYEKASQILFEFLEIYPRSAHYHEAQVLLVEAYIANEKFDLANTQIEKILGTTKKGQFNAKALYLKGKIYLLLGNLQGAENTFASLIGKYGKEKSSQILNILNMAYLNLGEINHRKGLYSKSNENLLKITTFKNEVNSKMLSAKNYFMLKNYAEAINIYNEIISKADSNILGKIYYKMGLNYDNLNDYTRAIESYSKVIENFNKRSADSESQKNYYKSYLNISENYLKMDQPQAAIKSLKNYVKIAAKNQPVDEIQFKIGFLYETKLNDIERSIRIYYDFIDMYPRSKFADDAKLAIARCFEKKNEYSQALIEYENFLKLYPASNLYDKAIDRINYISKYNQIGSETTRVFSNLLTQLSRDNNNPQIIFQAGMMNFHQFKDYKTSIQLFRDCYVTDSDRSVSKDELLYFWARAYQLIGEKQNEKNEAYLDSATTTFNLLIDNFANSNFIANARYHLIEIEEAKTETKDSLFFHTKKQMLRTYKADIPESSFLDKVDFGLGKLLLAESVKSSVDSMEIYNHFQSVMQNSSDSSLKSEAAFHQALMFLLMNDTTTAEKKLKSFIDSYPGSHKICEAKFELAQIYENKGDYSSSRKYLEDIINNYFYSSYADSALFKIGKIYHHEKKYSDALKYFIEVYNKYQPTNFITSAENSDDLSFQQSIVNIADSYLNTGKTELAINYFNKYLDIFPMGKYADRVLYSLGRIYTTNNNVEQTKAIDYLLRLEKDFPQSSFMFNMLKDLADLYFITKNYEQAIEYYKKSFSYSAEQTEERAKISAQIIVCHYRLGNIQTADQMLKNFKSGYKDEEDLLSNIELEKGDYFLKTKNFNRAEDIFKNIRSKYKKLANGAKAEYLLGKLYFILNKDEDALEILTKMISKYPDDPIIPEVYVTLGNFYYFQARQVENAMLAYRKVVDFPNVDETTLKLGMHNLIKCYTDLGLRDQAIALIRQYINHYPESEDVFDKKIRMGIIFTELKEYDQAIQLFQNLKSEADLENEPRIQYWIGECYFGKGQFIKAISEYLKIVYLSRPTKLLNQYRVTAQYKSGLAYLKISQPENGRQLFEKIVQEQGAESVFGKPALKKINEIDRLLANKN